MCRCSWPDIRASFCLMLRNTPKTFVSWDGLEFSTVGVLDGAELAFRRKTACHGKTSRRARILRTAVVDPGCGNLGLHSWTSAVPNSASAPRRWHTL